MFNYVIVSHISSYRHLDLTSDLLVLGHGLFIRYVLDSGFSLNRGLGDYISLHRLRRRVLILLYVTCGLLLLSEGSRLLIGLALIRVCTAPWDNRGLRGKNLSCGVLLIKLSMYRELLTLLRCLVRGLVRDVRC